MSYLTFKNSNEMTYELRLRDSFKTLGKILPSHFIALEIGCDF